MTRISKPPQERKKEILDTALELFMKNGYEATSVGDIVEKLGVAQGLFYYYFKSKDEVYRAAMEQFADDFTSQLVSIVLDTIPLMDKIGKILKCMSDLIAESEHALMDQTHLPEHLDMDNRLSIHIAQSLIEPITGIFEELNEKSLIDIKNPEITATFIIFGVLGLVHGNPEHSHSPAFFSSDEVIQMIAGVLGLTTKELMKI